MDDTEFAHYDSLYEMNAPVRVDFDCTDISVNESIFDRQVVGEKEAKPFRDIGNITPQWAEGSLLSKNAKTPVTHSPLVSDISRRVTRSAVKELNKTLTPKQTSTPPVQVKPKSVKTSTKPVVQDESEEASDKPQMEPEQCPEPVQYKSVGGGTPIPVKKTAVKSERITPSPLITSKGNKPTEKRDSLSRPLRSRTSSAERPAYSGTPFKGKRSPLKTLRTRTKSRDSDVGVPSLRSSANSAKDTVASGQSMRKRTSSASTGSAAPTQATLAKCRSHSQSDVRGAAQPRSTSTGMSPALSRLMRPTESARLKRHEATSSPTKRKTSAASDSKPPKVQKSTIPKSPIFLGRMRTRVTPTKSTEDLLMEKIAKEKSEMHSLKKKNEEGLRSISASACKRGKPADLPTGKTHGMATRSDEAVKAKRSIYNISNQKPEYNYKRMFAAYTAAASSSQVYSNMPPRVTKACSPKFQTRLRERAPAVPSAAEREQMELEMIKQSQFKATPVDKDMLERGKGIKVLTRQPVTEPLPIKFATDERLAKHAEKQTEPSPAEPIMKAKPVPKATAVFRPKLDHKRTNAEPFTFETKDAAAKRRKEELIKKIEEEERKLREFKAKPLPPSPSPIPTKQVLPPTVPDPFQLRIDERGEQQQRRLRQKVEAETSRMLAATVVHAKPADVLKKAPFVPKKETPKVTEPFNIELSSSRRAEERKQYEQRKVEAEAEMRLVEEEAQRRKAAEEKKEMIKLRKETIIKPAPIKQYKPVQIKQSDKALTQPRSPRFVHK